MNAPVRQFPIRQVASWLHPLSTRWKALGLMKAYFDESGTHGGSLVTAIAGYVANDDTWTKVEAAWNPEVEVYAENGVKTFHMTDCIAGEGEFARMDVFFRKALIYALARVLSQHDVHAVWSGVYVEDWNEVVTDQDFLVRFPKPFDLCFEHIVRQLAAWARKYADGELVAPMFALQPEYHARMAEVGRAYGSKNWYRDVLGPIAFGCPSQVTPLQAADLIAHQIRAELERIEYGELTLENLGRTLALENATAFHGLHIGGCFDAAALQLAVEKFKRTGRLG